MRKLNDKQTPLFDCSTLHYANKALTDLSSSGRVVEFIDPAFRWLKRLDKAVWEEPEDHYLLFNSAYAGMCVGEENNIQIYCDDPTARDEKRGKSFIQFIFGLTALSQVVQKLCTSNTLRYIGGTHEMPLSFRSFGRYLSDHDEMQGSTPVWEPIRFDGQSEQHFIQWTKALVKSERSTKFINQAAHAAGTTPFLDMVIKLYDTSEGLDTPMSYECQNSKIGSGQKEYFSTHLLKSAVNDEVGNPINFLHARMPAYFVNSIYYDYIAHVTGSSYVANVMRAPFLHAVYTYDEYQRFERRTFLDALYYIIGFSRQETYDNPSYFPMATVADKEWVSEYYLFGCVLEMANDLDDILPAAYRLRKELSKVRKHYKTKYLDRNQIREALMYHESLKTKHLEMAVPVLGMNLATPSRFYQLLGKQKHLGDRKYLGSVLRLHDHLRQVYSLADRFEYLAKKSLSR